MHSFCYDHRVNVTFDHRQCYHQATTSDKVLYRCLNRGDANTTKLFHTPTLAKKPRYPLLNLVLDYNQTGFWCNQDENLFLDWSKWTLERLNWRKGIENCVLKGYGTIDASQLFRMLLKDRSFKGRKIVYGLKSG